MDAMSIILPYNHLSLLTFVKMLQMEMFIVKPQNKLLLHADFFLYIIIQINVKIRFHDNQNQRKQDAFELIHSMENTNISNLYVIVCTFKDAICVLSCQRIKYVSELYVIFHLALEVEAYS